MQLVVAEAEVLQLQLVIKVHLVDAVLSQAAVAVVHPAAAPRLVGCLACKDY
jgi:hypothetical protein